MYTNSPRASGLQISTSSRVHSFWVYRDLQKGRDGAHLIASVKPCQTLGPEYEMHFWSINSCTVLSRD